MSFSATGNLLSGSLERPDIVTFIRRNGDVKQVQPAYYCRLNIFGFLPIFSTVTGIGRALLGVVHTIVHLACSIFSENRKHHLMLLRPNEFAAVIIPKGGHKGLKRPKGQKGQLSFKPLTSRLKTKIKNHLTDSRIFVHNNAISF